MSIVEYLIASMNKHYFENEIEELTQQSAADADDPCWCGSGLKYRDCHLSIDDNLLKSITTRKTSCTKFT